MWSSNGYDIQMVEGDFGIKLPIMLEDMTITASDEFRIKITHGGQAVLTLTFDNISNNQFDLELTEAQSNTLKIGTYLYSLDWYQNGEFMCNIIPAAKFKVVDKA